MTIGSRIRDLRKRQNISQRQLAQAADLTVATISAIECGRTQPAPRTIEKISTALHVPVESITNEQPKQDKTFTAYQVRLIRKAIQFRIEEEAERLAVGMEVPRDEIMRVWEEHKDD
nr:helix-turn-helix transcriptional regulator [uncultured Ruminococcus sp.]